jgi:hypothetical protein
MSNDKTNRKIPPSPFETDYGQTRRDLYADCFHEWETCLGGTHQSKYRDPKNPKSMFDSHADATGSIYNTDCNNGKAITTESHSGAHRYWSMNACEHVGSHKEMVTWNGVHNHGSQYEHSKTTADSITNGAAKMKINISSDHATIRASSAGVDTSSSSQMASDTDGNRYVNHEGNSVHSYNGHTYIITKGDHGLYAQDGNIDHHADQKVQIFGKAAAHVTSDTTIILKAGTSSATITMTGDTVTIKASKIILDGETHLGGSGGTLIGLCGGGCSSKVYAV